MSDMSGRDATRRDDLHTLSVRSLERTIATAGIVMSRRQLLRHCKAGTFDAVKFPAANNVEEWFVAPASVEKGVADIKVLQGHRTRRDATRHDAAQISKQNDTDTSGHDATRQDMSAADKLNEDSASRQDMSRRDAPIDLDIYEHPYVKRLEAQVDKLEKKLDDQVRRTEDIQLRSQEKLLELQRMTAVGQSQTLADFMLKAKDWMLGSATNPDKSEEGSPAA